MNVQPFKEKLLAKRQELADAIARETQEGRSAAGVDVGDSADRAVEDTAADQALQSGGTDRETLQQVDDALQRMEQGTYGKCVICGKPIEPARLEAIPWTPYCLADQEALERAKGTAQATPTL